MPAMLPLLRVCPRRRRALRTLLAAGLIEPGAAFAEMVTAPPPAPLPSGVAPAQRVLGTAGPLVALLLPRETGAFEQVARALWAGVQAAYLQDGTRWTLEALAVDDDPTALAEVYAQLVARQCALVLGPVTRRGAQALIDLGPLGVPTLALSVPEREPPAVPGRAFMGLAIESECQQAATQAFASFTDLVTGRRPRAVAVSAATALARRGVQAFEDTWSALGGEWRGTVDATRSQPADLRARLQRAAPDVAVLALEGPTLRMAHAMLGGDVLAWGTALTNGGQRATQRQPELDGLHMMAMPYHVQLENPAVAAYPRAPESFGSELQRLYALGVDAIRVGQRMLAGDAAFEMDGLTGWLRYDAVVSSRVERTAVPAVYRDGMLVAL